MGTALRRQSAATRRWRSTTPPRFAASSASIRRWPCCRRPPSTTRTTAKCSPPMARRSPPAATSSSALAIIQRAQTPDQPDWRLLSAEAAILDQLGNHDEARKLYRQALDLAPNEPSVMSNLGMSYVLTGELKQAEAILRKAVALAQCRQPRPPEPRARRRPLGALRGGGEDRQRRPFAGPGRGQCRLPQVDARPAERLAEAEGDRHRRCRSAGGTRDPPVHRSVGLSAPLHRQSCPPSAGLDYDASRG